MPVTSPAHVRRARGVLPLIAVVAIAAVALAGCGSSGSSGDSSSTAGSSSSSAAVAQAKKEVARYYKGTWQNPPAKSPPPARGKNVWVISCGQSAESCAAPIRGVTDAAKLMGWKTNLVDAKFDPAKFGEGVRQAIAAHADAVIIDAADCDLIKQPLVDAKRAKMPVVGLEGLDCSETHPGAESLFIKPFTYAGGTFRQAVIDSGKLQADYIIAKTNGKAKVINFSTTESSVVGLIQEGFESRMKQCTSCKVVAKVSFVSADLGPKLQQRAQQVISQHPEANAIQVPYDSVIVSAAGPAVRASGRTNLLIMGGEGFNLDLIRQGVQQDAAEPSSAGWTGFAAVDTLNRYFHGEGPAPSGLGMQLIDADHGLPASGPFNPPIDYVAEYKKAWGVGS